MQTTAKTGEELDPEEGAPRYAAARVEVRCGAEERKQERKTRSGDVVAE